MLSSSNLLVLVPFSILIFLAIFYPKKLYYLLIFAIFTTEFYQLFIRDGIFRISYFISLALFVGLLVYRYPYIKKLIIKSKLVLLLLIFIFYNIVVIVFNTQKTLDALFSFGLLIIMFSFVINTYYLLATKRGEKTFFRIIIIAALIASIFGLCQYLIYVTSGKIVAFTETQTYNVSISRPTSFFYEADTFGKNLMIMCLLTLPFIFVAGRGSTRNRIKIHLSLPIIFMVNLGLTLTRSAIAGFLSGVLLLYLILMKIRSEAIFGYKSVQKLILVFVIFVGLFVASGQLSELAEKSHSIFNIRQTIKTDASASLRYRSMTEPLSMFLDSGVYNIVIGSGWVNLKSKYGDVSLNPTSNIFVNVFIYSGIIGLAIFVAILVQVLKTFYNTYKQTTAPIALGCLLAFVGGLVASQMAPMMIAMEFWMLFGIAAYFETKNRRRFPLNTYHEKD